MPICAWRSAGASLAPSPHMPTVTPPAWNALTRLYLSSGSTPANTAKEAGRTSFGIGPAGHTAPIRPTACATIPAVRGASPVTITVRTPSARNSLTNPRRIRAGRIAQCDHPGKPHRLGWSGRDRQNSEACLQAITAAIRGRLRPGEASDHGKGALDHALRGASRVRHCRFRHLGGRIDGYEFDQVRRFGAGFAGGDANCPIDRILAAVRTGERCQRQHMRGVEPLHWMDVRHRQRVFRERPGLVHAQHVHRAGLIERRETRWKHAEFRERPRADRRRKGERRRQSDRN